MKYKVNMQKTDEGYAIWAPGLPGCWSQGKTEKEAMQNIKDAIQAYLDTVEELSKDKESRYVEVGQNYAQSTGDKSSTCCKGFRKIWFLDNKAGQTYHDDQWEKNYYHTQSKPRKCLYDGWDYNGCRSKYRRIQEAIIVIIFA